jgi:hypothetical protein
MTRSQCVAGLWMLCSVALAVEPEPDWDALDAQFSTQDINEGQLEFLLERPAGRILRTGNSLTITPDSLQTGWLKLAQCQSSLDPIDSVQVVYRYTGMRNLRVVSAHNMASAQVEANTVQLSGVQQGGEVCIEAEVQVLNPDGQGGYRLRSGPFHRRFLDGYYPVELAWRITWPPDRLALRQAQPREQPGLALHVAPGELSIDALFEGELVIELAFDKL